MRLKKVTSIVLGSLLILGLSGCGMSQAKKKEVTSDKLVVQFVPTNNDGSMEAKTKPFAEYLSKKLDLEVEVTLATDYSTISEAMDSGKVDLGIMPPAAYVRAKDMHAAQAILTSQLKDYDQKTGEPLDNVLSTTFKGEVLVRNDSNLKELKDLKNKKIATLNPNSASGYIYPVAELKDLGIDPVQEATLTTVNDIPSEITAVLNGQMDAAFVFEGARNVFNAAFPDKDLTKELRVLYLTKGDIPNDAIAVNPKMSTDLKEKIKETFLEMKNDPEGKEAMNLWGHLGYEEAADDAYNTIRAYTEKAAE
ncbi:phosphonate transport system substrate-binding protein [Enterococcus sp. DIV1537a]|uniref:phosphate/phosphite/phosphonate ABC transporter substrate-binding protein n=1 Tax=Enterococcus sp. DIV1537a TaxID=2774733 RepID=UPI003F21E5DA